MPLRFSFGIVKWHLYVEKFYTLTLLVEVYSLAKVEQLLWPRIRVIIALMRLSCFWAKKISVLVITVDWSGELCDCTNFSYSCNDYRSYLTGVFLA